MSSDIQNTEKTSRETAPREARSASDKNDAECSCPRPDCPRHGNCKDCVKNHRETDSMPFCLFMNNDGNKSLENFYKKLKERFEVI